MDPLEDAQVELHEAEKVVRRVGRTVGDECPELAEAEADAVRALRFYRWKLAMAARVGSAAAA